MAREALRGHISGTCRPLPIITLSKYDHLKTRTQGTHLTALGQSLAPSESAALPDHRSHIHPRERPSKGETFNSVVPA